MKTVYATELAGDADQLAGWGIRIVMDGAERAGHAVTYVPLGDTTPRPRPDVWLVSLPYAGNAWRIRDFFEAVGESMERTARGGRTCYILGGHAVVNTSPFLDVFDACFVGEADDAMGEIIGAAPDRDRLASVEGIDTGDAREVTFRLATDPSQRRAHYSQGSKEGVGETVYLEVARGCRSSCTFCEIGWAYTYWQRSREDAEAHLRQIEATYGKGRAVLSAPDTDGIDWFDEIVADGTYTPRWRSTRIRPYLKSRPSRADKGRIRFGVEGVTERLRTMIGKPMTDGDIAAALARSQEEGYRMGRMFLIAGLPTETASDRRHAGDLLSIIRRAGFRHWKACDVKITPLSPQPLTPLQRFGVGPSITAAREYRRLRTAMQKSEPLWRSVMVDQHTTEADVWKRMRRGDGLAYLAARPRGDVAAEGSPDRRWERVRAWAMTAGIDYDRDVIADIPLDAEVPWSRVRSVRSALLAKAEAAIWRRANERRTP